jgi:hypothetical protein
MKKLLKHGKDFNTLLQKKGSEKILNIPSLSSPKGFEHDFMRYVCIFLSWKKEGTNDVEEESQDK